MQFLMMFCFALVSTAPCAWDGTSSATPYTAFRATPGSKAYAMPSSQDGIAITKPWSLTCAASQPTAGPTPLFQYLAVCKSSTCPVPGRVYELYVSSTWPCVRALRVQYLAVCMSSTCPVPGRVQELYVSSTWPCARALRVQYLAVCKSSTCPVPGRVQELYVSSTWPCARALRVQYLAVYVQMSRHGNLDHCISSLTVMGKRGDDVLNSCSVNRSLAIMYNHCMQLKLLSVSSPINPHLMTGPNQAMTSTSNVTSAFEA
ncbi:hypothetical protein P4O66_004701 [Electrophorus voltai]|uniref:Uncharacterized protein n=1 Tax=Electrophorus voltai TaxID=2609070 RepID=A0AAD9E1N4_9TELE|nr:hypothetical protein P4O66_004701 [Electrophorus voltai]